jgi:mono/diheme cytochrome c family protein
MRAPLMMAGALALTMSLAACDEKLADLTGPTPNLQPTFSSIQHEIFESADSSGRPACIQCHAPLGTRPAVGGLNLTNAVAYASLVGVPAPERRTLNLVTPGDPENSYLIHKLEGSHNILLQRMPLGGPYLSSNQILVIRRWIEIGAPNN